MTSLDTRLAHIGTGADPATGALVPALHASTTFARGANYELHGDFIYARYSSPTVAEAEAALARLDGGAGAMLFGAGLSATTTVFETLRSGDHVVAPRVMYHGAQDWLHRLSERRGIGLTFFDAADPEGLGRALDGTETVNRGSVDPGGQGTDHEHDRTVLVWVESPVNPTWDVIDIRAAAETAHAAGAVLVVDSTAAPPTTTRPLELGADLVFHSVSKYLNGHSDVLGGALITRVADDRWEEIKTVRKLTGGVLAPFEAWLLMRGLRTLAVRFDRASASALTVASHFENHPLVQGCVLPRTPEPPRPRGGGFANGAGLRGSAFGPREGRRGRRSSAG